MRTKSMFRSAAGTAVGITLAGIVLASEVTNPAPPTAKSVETGRQLFQKYCKGCHGGDATVDDVVRAELVRLVRVIDRPQPSARRYREAFQRAYREGWDQAK